MTFQPDRKGRQGNRQIARVIYQYNHAALLAADRKKSPAKHKEKIFSPKNQRKTALYLYFQ